MKNSTDFAMGRRPKLNQCSNPKSFFISTFQGVEIIAILCWSPLKKCYTVQEHDPTLHICQLARSPHRRASQGGLKAYSASEERGVVTGVPSAPLEPASLVTPSHVIRPYHQFM